MNAMLLFEAIGCLDDELLEKSEKDIPRKYTTHIVKWAALAACVCIICMAAMGMLAPKKSEDNAMESIREPNDMKNDGFLTEDVTESVDESSTILYNTKYFRINDQVAEQFTTKIVRNTNELTSYIAENNACLEDSDFIEECAKYDQSFFEKKQLLLLQITENSGSIQINASGNWEFTDDGRVWRVDLVRYVPAEGTDDMAYWLIAMELDAGTLDIASAVIVEKQTYTQVENGTWTKSD